MYPISLCYPFVKWAGGKTLLLHTLNRHNPASFNRNFEPFWKDVLCIYVPSKNLRVASYLSDINVDLIIAYNVVKDKVEELVVLLKHHEIGHHDSHYEYYYKLRANMEPTLTSIERATRFITLNKTCYTGL